MGTIVYLPTFTITMWCFQILFIFTPILGEINDPIWRMRIFFKWVGSTMKPPKPDKNEASMLGKNRDQGLKIEEPLGRYPFPVSNAGPPAGLSQRFETREETSREVGAGCRRANLKCYFNSYAHRIIWYNDMIIILYHITYIYIILYPIMLYHITFIEIVVFI